MSKLNTLFSIVIPTYNRPKQLSSCLQAIAQLNYPPNLFEVIVVDDGSEIPLDNVIDPLKDKLNLLMLTQPRGGPSSARNNGAKHAKGNFLAFTDDDCRSESNWLRILEQNLNENPECLIGGKTFNLLEDNPFSAASQMICDLAYRHYNVNHNHSNFFSSNNIAMSREKFHDVGGFDENFKTAEDRELCKRWLKNGLSMIYAPEAIIYHAHHLTFFAYIKQHFNYGRGSYKFYNKTKEPGYFKNLLRFNLNPNNLVIYPLSKHKGMRGVSLVTLMFLWQITNALGFIYEALSYNVNSINGLRQRH